MVTIDKEESEAINSIRFICILTVAMVHCYPPHSSIIASSISNKVSAFLETYLSASTFCEDALGIFFLISGYLFFRSTPSLGYSLHTDYILKIKSRIYTLVIFYLAWSSVGFIVHCLQHNFFIPDWKTIISGYWPVMNDTPTWGRGLWFIRSLIFFTILSPIYYISVKYLKHFVLVIILFLHEMPINFPYFNVYLLLGTYLAFMGINLKIIAELLNWKTSLTLILILQLLVRTGVVHIPIITPISILLFLSVFFHFLYRHPLPQSLSISSTFIYAAHFYPAAIFKVLFFQILPNNIAGCVLNMYLSCICAVILCIVIYRFIINRFTILNILFAGNRFLSRPPSKKQETVNKLSCKQPV